MAEDGSAVVDFVLVVPLVLVVAGLVIHLAAIMNTRTYLSSATFAAARAAAAAPPGVAETVARRHMGATAGLSGRSVEVVIHGTSAAWGRAPRDSAAAAGTVEVVAWADVVVWGRKSPLRVRASSTALVEPR